MRLFVGIPLADSVVRELTGVVARLRAPDGSSAGVLRWTDSESWHITLQFLGNATPEQFACLNARLSAIRAAPVHVRLGQLGGFDRAGVFFADVVVTPELAALQQKVVGATGGCGFVAETRPFHPHITLARRAGNQRTSTLKEIVKREGVPPFSGFTGREFLLYESHIGREGAQYEVRRRFALAGA